MPDFTGPRPTGLPAIGIDRTGSRPGGMPTLETGTRLQVQIIGQLAERGVQLRPVTPSGAQSPEARAPSFNAQLATPLPSALLPGNQAGPRMALAEVVRTEPRLEVRLLPLPGSGPTGGTSTSVPATGANPGQASTSLPATGQQDPAQWLLRELRHQIPGARSLANGMQTLQATLASATAAAPQPGANEGPLLPAMNRLLDLAPPAVRLVTPEGVHRHMQQSGLWLEAMLAQGARANGSTAPAQDLKAQLLRVAEHLRQAGENRAPPPATTTPSTPPAPASAAALPPLGPLTGLVEGMLKRITTLQLQSLPSSVQGDDEGQPRWFFELPFRSPQGIHALAGQLQHEAGRPPDRPEGWTLVLDLDLQALGPTRVAIALRDDRVSVHFTAERPETAASLQSGTPELRQRLIGRDLSIGSVSVREGRVEPQDPASVNLRDGLLDERA
nr:flagellar hook-length control protein FliK [Thioalkalivibrio sp. ARh3]